jgi:hypothetical protein
MGLIEMPEDNLFIDKLHKPMNAGPSGLCAPGGER